MSCKKIKCFTLVHADDNVAPNFASQSYDGVALRTIYDIPMVTPAKDVKVVTVAIVIGYHSTTLLTDLSQYWGENLGAQGVPFPNVRVHTMPKQSPTDNANLSAWNMESSLDLEMVANANPNADIWVIESSDISNESLCEAVKFACGDYVKADVISMSWGSNDVRYNIPWNTYFNAPNVCFLASSGDTHTSSWPSVSPNILSVGGTSLTSTGSKTTAVRTGEFTWPYAGCGYSTTIVQPAYQSAVDQASAYRSTPDLALIANPQTGVQVFYNGKQNTLGGTSVACPVFAGMLSAAIQLRYNNGKGPLSTVYKSPNDIHVPLYKTLTNGSYNQCFYDVRKGTNLSSHNAGTAFDIATGLGAPTWQGLQNLANM